MFAFNRVWKGLKEVVGSQPDASVAKQERTIGLTTDSNTDGAEPVILHIYSISDRVNRFSLFVGLGLYHTAVEIYGREHSFIGHPFKFTGIVSITPKTAAYIYQEGLEMGRTKLKEQEIGICLKELGKIFTGSSYHLLHNNCNHFSSAFVKRLCNGKLPTYINRAANSACCLPFLDTMFSAKIDSERFFVEVLYLTLNGDLNCVMEILGTNSQTNLSRYVSFIEASFDDRSIPKCLPVSFRSLIKIIDRQDNDSYDPVIKDFNPFTPSRFLIELVKQNLCTNFIFTQSKFVYGQAFDLYEELKSRNSTLADYNPMIIPGLVVNDEMLSSADYSPDIHRYLNYVQEILIETVRRPILADAVRSEEFSSVCMEKEN